ncbi:hypothetical protein ULMA_13970 [Patiriisocius marinus]|uniref:Uncharacterized protein n=1 Tax=Patiriisocius marinus TaxID=1397112 RepID=A0A5J4IP08_9FLAO|nr:hypothetical protein [Patiriisocius marinus]GER59289.1 hypothetical protein ULMA_13970 [Patiriisocius marinus]
MHGSLSHFKATLQRRKDRIDTKEKTSLSKAGLTTRNKKPNFNFPKMNNEEFAQFKANLESKKRKNTLINIILFVFILTLTISVLWYLN